MANNFTFSKNVKFMESNENLNSFMCLLRKYPSLSASEEKELFIKYRNNGDKDARDKIFLHNQRFIYSNAKIYARDSDEVMDYVNEGNIALNEAIEKFDINQDNKFITFAVWYIRRQMNYYLINTRDSVTKTNGMKLFKKVDRIIQKFYLENSREPSLYEIQDILEKEYNIVINNVSDLYDLNISSINNEIDDDFTMEDSSEFSEKTSSVNDYVNEEDNEYTKNLVSNVLNIIPKNKREIIKKLYGIGYDKEYSIDEIANQYNVSSDLIRNIENEVISYLKENIKISDI